MTEEREPKRVRQACQNCRRKKTRCSGEKPACSFCVRLNQDCCYDSGQVTTGSSNDLTLSSRVALLESKLSLLDSSTADHIGFLLGRSPTTRSRSDDSRGSGTFGGGPSPFSKFTHLPPQSVLRSITQTYFRHCHNQPYCYFPESYFRRRLEDGSLPSHLLMAVIAIAGRFSQDPFFEGQTQAATESFARTAWAEVFEKCFSEDYALDISVVQAANMLAVVDFTAGKHKLAWIKIGLAVRFAQMLGLLNEPPADLDLTPEQQDERVFTFWSVYLLDRLVSCGYNRPPAIADSDCTVRLPSENTDRLPTLGLGALYDTPDVATAQRLDHFAHTVFMASALGRVERYALQRQHRAKEICPPWDASSGYTTIYSLLLGFETYSDAAIVPFPEAIDEWYTTGHVIDQQAAGHFVFSVILYHMNHCLLHHPFLLRHRLDTCKSRVPPSFLQEALRRGREHAQLLTLALRNVQKKGLTYTSFYGYACMVAGTIHRLFSYHDNGRTSEMSRQLLDYSIEFLEGATGIWSHYPRMAAALRDYQPDATSAKQLVSTTLSPGSPSDNPKDQSLDVLWDLLDYGWLSDSARAVSPSSPTAYTHQNPINPSDDMVDPFDMRLDSMSGDGPFDRWSEIEAGGELILPVDLDHDLAWATGSL